MTFSTEQMKCVKHSKAGGAEPALTDKEGLHTGQPAVPLTFCPYFLPLFSSCISVNSEKSQVKLSLLPNDTGKPDVFSASPEPPLLNQKERKEGAEERALKREEKEQKSQKRKEKNQKGQEETEMFSQEKKEPQKSQRSRQGKREHQEPASEQVGAGEGQASPRPPPSLLSE